MARVTLHGAVPVYVVVDTDQKKVSYVCTSDEEFQYLAEATGLPLQDDDDIPEAYNEGGSPLNDPDLAALAYRIAEGDEPDSDPCWPSWSYGW